MKLYTDALLKTIPNGSTGTLYRNTRLFTGREYDTETGLYYQRARHYDPASGRFLQPDPIRTKDDVNLYRYVGNSPLVYVDRFGKEKVLIILGIDKDGIIPKVDRFGNVIGGTNNYVMLQYQNISNMLNKQGTKYDVQVAINFNDFDAKINAKQREKVIFIGHGFQDGIAINSSDTDNPNSWIDSNTLSADVQNTEQQARLKQTELFLLSCDTGKESLFGNSIAQDIQNHYGFKDTQAPTTEIWSSGEIYEYRNTWSPTWNDLGRHVQTKVTGTVKTFY